MSGAFPGRYQEHRAATKAIAQKKGGHFPRIVRAAPLRLVQIATARLYLSQLPECGEALVAGGRVRKPFLGFCLPRREPGVCLELTNEFSARLCVDHWLRCPSPAGRFDPCDLARREMRNDGFDLAAPNGRFEDEAYRCNSQRGIKPGRDGSAPADRVASDLRRLDHELIVGGDIP